MVFHLRVWCLISASSVSDNRVFSAQKLNSTLPQIDFVKHLYVRTVKLTILIQIDYICQNTTIGRVLIREKHVKVAFINQMLVGVFDQI